MYSTRTSPSLEKEERRLATLEHFDFHEGCSECKYQEMYAHLKKEGGFLTPDELGIEDRYHV
jgi:hypothetical protein